jgi:hypothetical protein
MEQASFDALCGRIRLGADGALEAMLGHVVGNDLTSEQFAALLAIPGLLHARPTSVAGEYQCVCLPAPTPARSLGSYGACFGTRLSYRGARVVGIERVFESTGEAAPRDQRYVQSIQPQASRRAGS